MPSEYSSWSSDTLTVTLREQIVVIDSMGACQSIALADLLLGESSGDLIRAIGTQPYVDLLDAAREQITHAWDIAELADGKIWLSQGDESEALTPREFADSSPSSEITTWLGARGFDLGEGHAHPRYWDELLRSTYAGRSWIIAMDRLAAQTGIVRELDGYGAASIYCVAGARGTGPLPESSVLAGQSVLDISASTMMDGVRMTLEGMANLPDEDIAKIDAFDPSHTARSIGTIFDDGRPVGRRKKYGARAPEWMALEDKIIIDQVWDAVGVPRAPRTIVDISDLDALKRAHDEHDVGSGSVWAADNSEGFHGGGEYTRWVNSPERLARALEFFKARSKKVRVMPFLEGVPCSIHGLVFPDYTVSLRPCEMIILRSRTRAKFHYARAASFWDPPTTRRDEMRDMVRRVGDHLRETVGYRGAFTIDGVMTSEGFRPSELNPRIGAALGVVCNDISPMSLFLLEKALIEGEPLEWRARALEAMLLERADARRAGVASTLTTQRPEESRSLGLILNGDAIELVKEGELVDIDVTWGPAPAGGYMMMKFNQDRTPIGPSIAPSVAKVIRFLDQRWSLGIGELEASRDVSA